MGALRTYTLTFPSNVDGHLTHQVRNLGEDLRRCVEREGLGDLGGIQTVDRATDTLVVRVHKRRMIGRVGKIVEETVRAHLMADRTVIERSE